MTGRTPHTQHDEPTLGCLDCAAKPEWAEAYYQLALEDGRRIVEAAERTRKALHGLRIGGRR